MQPRREPRRIWLIAALAPALAAMLAVTAEPARAQSGPTLAISPPSSVVAVGGTNRFFAVYDPDGAGPALPQHLEPSSVAWSSSDARTLLMTGVDGVGYGRARGPATVRAAYNGLVASAAVQVAGSLTSHTLTAPDGRERSYALYIPDTYTGAPAPLVLAFHGGQGNGRILMYQSQLNTAAARHGAVVAYPDGIGGHWNAGGCCGMAAAARVDDVGFARRLVERVKAQVRIDPARVYATGFSNGAMLAHRLGFELSDAIAAIGPVGAGLFPGGDFAAAPAARPVSVIQFHGTTDTTFPYDTLPETIAVWLERNGIPAAAPFETYARGIVTCETYPSADADVTMCTADPSEPVTVNGVVMDGGGHAWPGGVKVYADWADVPTADIDASAAILDFFAQHALPGASAAPAPSAPRSRRGAPIGARGQ